MNKVYHYLGIAIVVLLVIWYINSSLPGGTQISKLVGNG